MSGSIFGICMPMSTPAAAASAEPSANVIAMIRSVEIPMSFAASRLKDTARIAFPVRVFRMKKRSRIISRNETAMTVICSLVSRTPATMKSARGASDGKNFGSGPKTSCATFSMKSDTPIAVMSSVRRASRRTGRYASRSIRMPEEGAREHRAEHHEQRRRKRGLFAPEAAREVIADVGAHHVDVAVREVDEAQDAVHHRVAERDQRVDRPERQAVDQLLEEGRHAKKPSAASVRLPGASTTASPPRA